MDQFQIAQMQINEQLMLDQQTATAQIQQDLQEASSISGPGASNFSSDDLKTSSGAFSSMNFSWKPSFPERFTTSERNAHVESMLERFPFKTLKAAATTISNWFRQQKKKRQYLTILRQRIVPESGLVLQPGAAVMLQGLPTMVRLRGCTEGADGDYILASRTGQTGSAAIGLVYDNRETNTWTCRKNKMTIKFCKTHTSGMGTAYGGGGFNHGSGYGSPQTTGSGYWSLCFSEKERLRLPRNGPHPHGIGGPFPKGVTEVYRNLQTNGGNGPPEFGWFDSASLNVSEHDVSPKSGGFGARSAAANSFSLAPAAGVSPVEIRLQSFWREGAKIQEAIVVGVPFLTPEDTANISSKASQLQARQRSSSMASAYHQPHYYQSYQGNSERDAKVWHNEAIPEFVLKATAGAGGMGSFRFQRNHESTSPATVKHVVVHVPGEKTLRCVRVNSLQPPTNWRERLKIGDYIDINLQQQIVEIGGDYIDIVQGKVFTPSETTFPWTRGRVVEIQQQRGGQGTMIRWVDCLNWKQQQQQQQQVPCPIYTPEAPPSVASISQLLPTTPPGQSHYGQSYYHNNNGVNKWVTNHQKVRDDGEAMKSRWSKLSGLVQPAGSIIPQNIMNLMDSDDFVVNKQHQMVAICGVGYNDRTGQKHCTIWVPPLQHKVVALVHQQSPVGLVPWVMLVVVPHQ